MPLSTASDELTRQLKALAHPDRLRLLQLLGEPERFPQNLVDTIRVGVCVNDLAVAAQLPQSTASHHLSVLEAAGLLQTTRHGQWKYARPARETLESLAQVVGTLGTSRTVE